jgi:4-alpha-glucanotransferase
MIQLEDLAGERDQANLPGTTEGHPNWRRRLSLPVDRLLASPEVKRFAAAVSQERARG